MCLRRAQEMVMGRVVFSWVVSALVLFSSVAVTTVVRAGDKHQVRTEVRVEIKGPVCRRCDVQAQFILGLRTQNANTEYVELEHGVGIFYTTKQHKRVPELQVMVAEAVSHLEEINAHPGDSHLCEYCAADFHIYSQLDHEVLVTSRGIFLLITSEDPNSIRAVKQLFLKRRSREFRDVTEYRVRDN